MRLFFKMEESKDEIPINYQNILTSAIHKWIGRDNSIHGNLGQFSFSWLKNIEITLSTIKCTSNSYWFFSTNDRSLVKKIITGVQKDSSITNGTKVREIIIQEEVSLNQDNIYTLGSPVLIKLTDEKKTLHLNWNDQRCNDILTNLMKRKMKEHEISSENCSIQLINDNGKAKTKIIDYKGIKNKVNFCSVKLDCTEEQIKFIKCVGIGHSTGIGFGSIE